VERLEKKKEFVLPPPPHVSDEEKKLYNICTRWFKAKTKFSGNDVVSTESKSSAMYFAGSLWARSCSGVKD
jgi:hypothetical protein